MIYTVTFNPSLDYIIQVPSFSEGIVNRTADERIYAGGKGLNVSMMLRRLGVESIALGFTAGFTGSAILSFLREQNCTTEFINLRHGASRINVKLKSELETEINGQGPAPTDEDLEQLYQKLDRLKIGDVLVLAGSIPRSMPPDTYEQILSRLYGRGISVAVDATGELLLRVLKFCPFLIKPNEHELIELCGREAHTDEELLSCAKELQFQGARNVIISLAERGALLVTEKGAVHRLGAPGGEAVNSVGAGDSMLAGFLAGFLRTGDYLEAFRLGIATGSATAFSEWLATEEEVNELLALVPQS
ncbi:MAG: 1-phosphofructokinase [Ruminococcus sp.]|nr:1-phosphofructokinase [Ruminococcus sp.]MBQ8905666.1 1-phosphofructokinase [Ruminococcus sp.]